MDTNTIDLNTELAALNTFHNSLGPDIVELHQFKSSQFQVNRRQERPFFMESGERLVAPFPALRTTLESVPEPVTFILTTSAHPAQTTILDPDFGNLPAAGFLNDKATMILVHGWMNSVDDDFPRWAAAAFLRQPECNVILVNWHKAAAASTYLPSRNFAQTVLPQKTSELLIHLVRNGFISSEDIHLVGFSMGSHGSGIACKIFSQNIGQKPGRLDGLDPPKIGFQPKFLDNPSLRMDSDDAVLTTAIYTSRLQTDPVAQVNYYPNNGTHPGSSSITEDHFRSAAYYIDGILHPNSPFVATKASSWESYAAGECQGLELMGHRINQAAKPGLYYLKTKDNLPFAVLEP